MAKIMFSDLKLLERTMGTYTELNAEYKSPVTGEIDYLSARDISVLVNTRNAKKDTDLTSLMQKGLLKNELWHPDLTGYAASQKYTLNLPDEDVHGAVGLWNYVMDDKITPLDLTGMKSANENLVSALVFHKNLEIFDSAISHPKKIGW